MTAMLMLICQGESTASREGRFPRDEPLTEQAQGQACLLRGILSTNQTVWCAPQLAARQTAAALALSTEVDDALRDLNYGDWAGLPLKQVIIQDDKAFSAWLNGATPPGGEPLEALAARCGDWLTRRAEQRCNHYAVVSAATIRAMAVAVLGAPIQAFAHIDIHPLSVTELSSDGRRWNLRQLGRLILW